MLHRPCPDDSLRVTQSNFKLACTVSAKVVAVLLGDLRIDPNLVMAKSAPISPLLHAIQYSTPEVVEAILVAKADPNAEQGGVFPFSQASFMKSVPKVKVSPYTPCVEVR